MAWQLAVELGLIAADYAYHRWIADPPPIEPPQHVIVPQAQAGATVPLLWGRYRVKAPFLAWAGRPSSFLADDFHFYNAPFYTPAITGYLYQLDQLFNVAIGFQNGTQRLKSMWIGDVELGQNGDPTSAGLSVLNGDGTGGDPAPYSGAMFVTTAPFFSSNAAREITCGYVEFLNGASDQTLVTPDRYAGAAMVDQGVDATLIPGYRGYLSVFLFNRVPAGFGASVARSSWIFGSSSTLPTVSFEMSSYATGDGIMGPDITDVYGEGVDSNPMNALYDLLVATFGKLGIDPSYIDTVSVKKCAATLYAEGHGYSRSVEGFARAGEIAKDIFRQVDGGMYEDTSDGKLHVYLVRQDYDPNAVPVISPTNCKVLQNLAIIGWAGVPNRFRVTYPSRVQNYQDESVMATNQASAVGANQANAVGQNGGDSEIALDYRGICTSSLAQQVVAREQLAQSRPITRCTAIVNRQFYATNPGDVVAINWPEYGWVGVLFRVARVSRGTLEDGRIKLDLLQEYFDVQRGVHKPGGIAPFPRVGNDGLLL